MDTQQSRHVVLENTPSDLVPPPILPVQMLVAQTLHTISHDQLLSFHPLLRILVLVWTNSSGGLDR